MFKTHRTFDLSTGVKNNTIAVVVSPAETIVVYHKTIVFRHVHKTNKVYLTNGGWDTVSTRIVINRALSQTPGFDSYYLAKKSKTTYLHSCYLKAPEQFQNEATLKEAGQAGKAWAALAGKVA